MRVTPKFCTKTPAPSVMTAADDFDNLKRANISLQGVAQLKNQENDGGKAQSELMQTVAIGYFDTVPS